jgi:hypothetical protein
MTSAAFTIKVFGVYALLAGLTLLLVPNVLLGLLAIPETQEVWIRVVGAFAVVVGYYYWACAAGNARPFFVASVSGRVLFALTLVALIFLAGAPVALLLFAALELLGAGWTFSALRRESRPG